MKVLFLNSPLTLSIIPRIYPLESDVLTISFRNEMSNIEFNPDFTFSVDDYLKITLNSQPSNFKSANKYVVMIKNGNEIIYLGKVITLNEGTDVQNYEYKMQTNGRYSYK